MEPATEIHLGMRRLGALVQASVRLSSVVRRRVASSTDADGYLCAMKEFHPQYASTIGRSIPLRIEDCWPFVWTNFVCPIEVGNGGIVSFLYLGPMLRKNFLSSLQSTAARLENLTW